MPGNPSQTERVWYILEDASDKGLANDLGVNYAPKLANIGIGCPACVQTVTEDNPSPQANPFGPAVIHFRARRTSARRGSRCPDRPGSR